jgi:hypothetical protein
MNYQEADTQLTGRCKQRRKVGNNTYLERRQGGAIALLLHSTDVVTFRPDGAIVLNSGGWRTPTTKDRINNYLPAGSNLWQENGQWFFRCEGFWGTKERLFADGMILYPNGTLDGGEPMSAYKEKLQLRRKVQRFAGAYMKAMKAGSVARPSGGDCCLMKMPGDTDHLLSHIEERYFVPSLLVRAMEVMPCSKVMKWAVGGKWKLLQGEDGEIVKSGHDWWSDYIRHDLQKCLSRYMLRQLGQAA